MDIQLVTFFLDSQEYGVDVMRVREIIAMTDITRTANSPGYVRGVINLRGAIVPVISLRSRLGLPDAEDETTSCIAVMDIGGELTGFIIDGISDVFRIRPGELEPPVDVVSQPWIEGILNREQKLVIYLNLANLA
jgi:purine-binding chemotaxis protein CheW